MIRIVRLPHLAQRVRIVSERERKRERVSVIVGGVSFRLRSLHLFLLLSNRVLLSILMS